MSLGETIEKNVGKVTIISNLNGIAMVCWTKRDVKNNIQVIVNTSRKMSTLTKERKKDWSIIILKSELYSSLLFWTINKKTHLLNVFSC